MNHQTNELVNMLLKYDASLDQIALKLEREANERFWNADEVNPVSLVKELRRISQAIPDLQAECRELLGQKQALLDAAQQELVGNHARLQQLCDRAGTVAPDRAALQSLQESMGQWKAKLRSQNALNGEGMSRQDLNDLLARAALGSNV